MIAQPSSSFPALSLPRRLFLLCCRLLLFLLICSITRFFLLTKPTTLIPHWTTHASLRHQRHPFQTRPGIRCVLSLSQEGGPPGITGLQETRGKSKQGDCCMQAQRRSALIDCRLPHCLQLILLLEGCETKRRGKLGFGFLQSRCRLYIGKHPRRASRAQRRPLSAPNPARLPAAT